VHKKGTPWPPEETEAIRSEVHEEKKTLQEIATRESVTRERIRQKVGNTGRRTTWKNEALALEHRAMILELVNKGYTDDEVAGMTNLSISTVRDHRYRAGIKRRHRHSVESSIRYAQLWFKEYGFSPGAADWTASRAIKQGHLERAQRLEEFKQKYDKPPSSTTVQRLFGSHAKLLRQAGLPPVPQGQKAHGRFKIEKG